MFKNSNRTDKRKFHFIYKTICVITGRWYIGMHSTDLIEDGYLGSGTRLWHSIKKHGEENHKREIIEFCVDRKSLATREKEIVNKEMLKEEQCMNLKPGGYGGIYLTPKQQASIDRTNVGKAGGFANRHKWSHELLSKCSKVCGENGKKSIDKNRCDWNGRKHSDAAKAKISATMKNKQNGEKNSQFGTCWINNSKVAKKIKNEQLDEMIALGWNKGRKLV